MLGPAAEEEADRVQPERVVAPGGRVDTFKKVIVDAAVGVRDFVAATLRRYAIYLPFRGAIESLRFWLRQREIQAWLDSVSETYQQEMGKARLGSASRDEQEEIARRHHLDQKWVEDELQKLYHSHYVHLANRLRIQVPPFQERGGAWMESAISHGWTLTPEALQALRNEIRAERKACRDEWLAWMPLLALAVGLVSALTALLVVWRH